MNLVGLLEEIHHVNSSTGDFGDVCIIQKGVGLSQSEVSYIISGGIKFQ